MKKIKKAIAATTAAFAVIAAIGTTASFAASDAVDSVDTVNNQVHGTYMYFEWGTGYAETINITAYSRNCEAEVYAYSNLTGEQVDYAFDIRDCSHNEAARADVQDQYKGSAYNYKCSGYIRVTTPTSSYVLEKVEDRRYPI